MDILHFLKIRLHFAHYFFETAGTPFTNIKKAIENEEPPFVRLYDESGEPPYLCEWLDADTGIDSVGLTTLSMIASSLQLFLNDWVKLRLEHRTDYRYNRKDAQGWFNAYKKIFRKVGLALDECSADLDLIEQAILARNRGQHPEFISSLHTTYSRSDLGRFPSPYFSTDDFRTEADVDSEKSSWWLSPKVFVDVDRLIRLAHEIENLCSWLEESYYSGSVDRLLASNEESEGVS